MICAACGSPNRQGRRFCGKCAAPLALTCPACGAANDADERFCGQCAAPLGEAAPARPSGAALASPEAASDTRTAERRHVTVMFADLVGFTSLSDQRDAEDIRDLLSRYFETARTVIVRYGGTVEKFIGDAVMAVWGAHTIQENDAERAVRAALEMVDAVAAFGEEVGAPGLCARAGVLTGEAAISIGAVGDGMVAGDLVNAAARVQAAAQPGGVLVGDSTRQATESAIVYSDAGSHQLKGIATPLRLWRADRVVAGRSGALRPTGLEPPFVGRDREIRLLKEYLHASAEESRARLLSIVGVGGVGKSRLAWELFKYVDGLSEEVYWHRGRCLAYGEGVAYWALSEMIRMRAGILENESPVDARDKLHRTVTDLVRGDEERAWVEPRLAHLVGLEEGAASEPRDLYAAWRFFFEQMAADGLSVLVFEDMQWADSGLLDFVEYLLEWSRSSPIFIITLARPEISDRRPGWGAGRRGLTSLYLEPLSAESMKLLLDGLVPGLPDDLGQRIRDRAAGIPLYAVETVRMLLDRGLLVERDGVHHATASLESLEVPESLHALIAARLDSLPEAERRVLQDAAVLGKSFTAHALRAVTEVTGDAVDAALHALVDKDLLSIQADPRSPERGQYVFVQDLVRSVAYGTLARRDRKLRHLAAATYLESGWKEEDEVTEVVASHLVEAHATDPDAADAGEIRDRAREALVLAGDHAASLAGADSAQRYYERALELGGDRGVRINLHLQAGRMALMQGRASAATAHLEASADLCAPGDELAQAAALRELARVKASSVGMAEALPIAERALAILSGAPEPGPEAEALVAHVMVDIGKHLYFLGEMEESLRRTELALQLAETAGLPGVLAYGLDTKACVLASRGRLAEAEILDLAALKLAIDNNDPLATVIAGNAGATLEEAEHPEAALALYKDGEARARRLGDRRGAAFNLLARVKVQIELGGWDDAAGLLDQYLEVDEPLMDVQVPGHMGLLEAIPMFVWRGEVEVGRQIFNRVEPSLLDAEAEARAAVRAARALLLNAAGDHAGALEEAAVGLRESLDPSFPLTARKAAPEAVDAAFALGRLDRVTEVIDAVRGRHRSGRQPTLDAHILRWQARLDEAGGDADAAAAGFARAIDAFAALHRPFWAAVTRLEAGACALAAGRHDEGHTHLREARATFEELRARPWVDRVDAVSSEPASANVVS
ncbi:MAG: ATP-binding protein [Candidatus Dormibacteria bacterium]